MRALDKRIQEQEQAIKTLRKEQAGVKVGLASFSLWSIILVFKGDGRHVQKQSEFRRRKDEGEG